MAASLDMLRIRVSIKMLLESLVHRGVASSHWLTTVTLLKGFLLGSLGFALGFALGFSLVTPDFMFCSPRASSAGTAQRR